MPAIRTRRLLWNSTMLAGAMALTLGLAGTAQAQELAFNIPAESLSQALRDYGKAAGKQLIFTENLVRGRAVPALRGSFTPEQALTRLLEGSGLAAQVSDKGVIMIVKVAAADAPSPAAGDAVQAATVNEVIVTAQKKEERLQDVPESVTVLSSNVMVQTQQLSLQDYYATVPGLSINVLGRGGNTSATIRGLNSGPYGNPVVGVTVDDVPVGETDGADVIGSFVPELDPADVDQIEVLKGPQGTLYGASSIGGVIRYVTKTPNLNTANGQIEVDGDTITGGGSGFGLRGSANIPVIADALAVRVSAFDRHDPGFIDNVQIGRHDVNSADVFGGRVDALWQATPDFSVRLSGLFQRTQGYGEDTIDTNALYQGPLNQSRLAGTGGYSIQNQLYTLTMKYKTDTFDVTSITSYDLFHQQEIDDNTPYYGGSPPFLAGGSASPSIVGTNKFTQEVRVSSRGDQKLEWQVGAFYTKENNGPDVIYDYANDLQTGKRVGLLLSYPYNIWYQEYSGFANLTYHFTKNFDVQIGVRGSHNNQQFWENISGPLQDPPFQLTVPSADSSFTYLVTPRLRLSDTTMVYARVSTGYQAGGPNTPAAPGIAVPLVYGPSTSRNYELGVKSQLFDRRLTIDADVFYIDWANLQLVGQAPGVGYSYYFNGHSARSDGVEFSTQFVPITGLTLSATGAYIDAQLTSNVGNGFPGVSGDPLPYSSKFTGSLSADERFDLLPSVIGFVGVTAAYVGKRYEGFPPSLGAPQISIPAYGYGNIHAGIETRGYTITVFAKNITNERGVLSTIQEGGVWRTSVIAPTTVGMSVSKAF